MNEQRKWTIVLMTITIFVMTTAFLPELVRAGNLEPSNVPRSTMHTLDEIYQKLEQLTPVGLAPVPQKETHLTSSKNQVLSPSSSLNGHGVPLSISGKILNNAG